MRNDKKEYARTMTTIYEKIQSYDDQTKLNIDAHQIFQQNNLFPDTRDNPHNDVRNGA